MSKYLNLGTFLSKNKKFSVELTFEEINKLLPQGNGLPDTALTNTTWWANNNDGHSQANAWLENHSKVVNIDLEEKKVIFVNTEREPELKDKLFALKDMVDTIADAINKNANKAALFCALAIPDICCQIEYGKSRSSGKDYEKWYDENIFEYEYPNRSEDEKSNGFRKMNQLDGQIIYLIRCKLFHEGSKNHAEVEKALIEKYEAEKRGKKVTLSFNLHAEGDVTGYSWSWDNENFNVSIYISPKSMAENLMWTAEGVLRDYKIIKG
ncbi:hypothetical protein I6N95_25675 [Vagococcus sp. BWB3-3]|uniref:DUF7662 domain-containing protein n=1 Tax=Vagococcus allomyrinae TaxID=2794353 RepID=A0A940PI74_9ENTE|nr:hypothetical protein [Vagococcus allomyrinae]MBP1044403.1 hypothetical protein [Vagococcus allomyrinae]